MEALLDAGERLVVGVRKGEIAVTCRDEILACVREIVAHTGRDEVSVRDVIKYMLDRGTSYSDSTIRTHIVSRLCANAPDHHAVTYGDFERTDRGTYRLRQSVDSPSPKQEDSRDSRSGRSTMDGKTFQVLAARVLGDRFGTTFRVDHAMPIGNPPKRHRFDLVSEDGRYVAECKAYSWTESGKVPSTKIATANEAVLYLSLLPPEITKLLVFRRSECPRRKETLAEYYARLQRHLLVGISVLELTDDATLVECKIAKDFGPLTR